MLSTFLLSPCPWSHLPVTTLVPYELSHVGNLSNLSQHPHPHLLGRLHELPGLFQHGVDLSFNESIDFEFSGFDLGNNHSRLLLCCPSPILKKIKILRTCNPTHLLLHKSTYVIYSRMRRGGGGDDN